MIARYLCRFAPLLRKLARKARRKYAKVVAAEEGLAVPLKPAKSIKAIKREADASRPKSKSKSSPKQEGQSESKSKGKGKQSPAKDEKESSSSADVKEPASDAKVPKHSHV